MQYDECYMIIHNINLNIQRVIWMHVLTTTIMLFRPLFVTPYFCFWFIHFPRWCVVIYAFYCQFSSNNDNINNNLLFLTTTVFYLWSWKINNWWIIPYYSMAGELVPLVCHKYIQPVIQCTLQIQGISMFGMSGPLLYWLNWGMIECVLPQFKMVQEFGTTSDRYENSEMAKSKICVLIEFVVSL